MADGSNGPAPSELCLTQKDLGVNTTPDRAPRDESERRAFAIYGSYFGPNWQDELRRSLFIDVRSATPEDRLREGSHVGWVSTTAEATTTDNHLVRNHIIIFNLNGATDWPLRTEVGESLYNLLENSAVTRSLPTSENEVARGFQGLVTGNVTPEAVVAFSGEILDKWNQVYTQRPSRYAGMNPNSQREYRDIPEWKSEGFSDAVAVEIRRRSGKPLDVHEQAVWSSLNPLAQEIIRTSVDAFLPKIQTQ
ncbi:hypothetical protein HY384_02345 [Candidatus Daviesbacteria bacterium]|nr:hypothetical protein [Candidatus Daviesbacteria bacterium]